MAIMWKKTIFLYLIALLLLASCSNGKKNNTENAPVVETKKETVQRSNSIPVSAEEIKRFVVENDDYFKRNEAEVDYVEKVDFQIPGGDNWLLRLNNHNMLIYAIDRNKIVIRYMLRDNDLEKESNFNIMQKIPGTRIGGGTSAYGDYNGDGKNDIFQYEFGGNGNYAVIYTYDPRRQVFVQLISVPFALLNKDRGPAPVEFLTYRDKYGFRVYFYQLDAGSGPDWVSEPEPRNKKWIFYTWDRVNREYTEVGEIGR
jgi:hypothetical protein